MARGSLAEHDKILPDRLKAELGVERGYSHDLRRTDSDMICHGVYHIDREISIYLLSLLQDGNEGMAIALKFLKDRVKLGQITFCTVLAHNLHSIDENSSYAFAGSFRL